MKDHLIALNRDTFLAEEGGETTIDGVGWEDFLRAILAAEFQIRRATRSGRPNQDLEAMIQQIRDRPSPRREIEEDSVTVWPAAEPAANIGVVKCVVGLAGNRFQNVKVFVEHPERRQWQCTYWQVTELPSPAT